MVKHIRRYFVTGLVLLVPLALTISVLKWLFLFADSFLGDYVNEYLHRQELIGEGITIPGIGIIITLVLIFLIGFFANTIFRGLLNRIEHWFSRLPIFRHIYVPSRQLMQFLFSEQRTAFQKAVAVEYPRKGIYSIGFLTADSLEKIDKKMGKELVGVLIPSAPNPITCYFIMVEKEDVIYLDISVGEALRLVISGGVLSPGEVKDFRHK